MSLPQPEPPPVSPLAPKASLTPDQIRAARARITEKLGPGPALEHTPCAACEGLGLMFDARDVGRRIATWRVSLGLTMTTIADQLGVTRVYYHNLEAGERAWHASRILEVISLLEAEETAQAKGKPRPVRKTRRIAGPAAPPKPARR